MESLGNLPIKDLREMRKRIGLSGAKGESKEAIIRQLQTASFPEAIMKEFQQKPIVRQAPKTVEVVKLTPEEVTEKLQAYINRGLKVRFDDVSWMMKNGAAEDSGSLSMPLVAILQKADHLMRARFPAQINGEFDEIATARGRIPVLSF